MEEISIILAAILYQEGGSYELNQSSINAVGDNPSVSWSSEPMVLPNAIGPEFKIVPVFLEQPNE